jgi:hypothetical protein
VERGVRVVKIMHRGWDQHSNLPRDLRLQCQDIDQPCAALIKDLKQRGLLKDTLVVWGGEFGRTVYSQGTLTDTNYGRDHHPKNFCMWMAGGGVKAGTTYGETDDFSYNPVVDPVHLRDLNATILRCMGIDHNRPQLQIPGAGSEDHRRRSRACGERSAGVATSNDRSFGEISSRWWVGVRGKGAAVFWGAHSSRVLVSASRGNELPFM